MIATMIAISVAVTSTAFTYRELHPAALFPYYRAAVENDIARVFVNPAYLPDSPLLFFNMNYAKPYSLEGLSAASLYAGTSLHDFGTLLSWNSFGIDEYKEDTCETSFGSKIGSFVSAGISTGISRLFIHTELVDFTEYFFNFRAGISCTPFSWLNLAFHQENIRSLFQENARDIHYPAWSAGTVLRPAPGLSVSWNINKTYFSYINSFAASANLLKWLSVSGGYSRETNTLAGSVNILVNGIAASYGLRYHSYLGTTHGFSVTLRYNAPALEEISYSKPLKPPCNEPINLAHCNKEDLARAGIDELIAERIVKYRETIGPLSKKSLIQMGLSSKEYRRLSHCFLNLSDDEIVSRKEEPKKKRVSKKNVFKKNPKPVLPYRNAETRKLLFHKLVQDGVKASSALRISELAKDLTRQKLVDSISQLPFLNDSEKQAAKKICAGQ